MNIFELLNDVIFIEDENDITFVKEKLNLNTVKIGDVEGLMNFCDLKKERNLKKSFVLFLFVVLDIKKQNILCRLN